ncbi:SGNH/GDSL hydrolase family protein [Mangrovicoccus ximenensis]|uniref:SGNH/GDSL hydrolase family protein n=1 Tax=Mangrovicoccus ximenensis TaxID=1911570 RepID=UPI000D3C6646|nr:SGNH/GDSL hydrolase family protein [Mangrovicoccus ximenensis]
MKHFAMSFMALTMACVLGFLVWIGMANPNTPRDREIAYIPLSGPSFRIVAFGSSLTHSNPWPKALSRSLSECFGQPVEVLRIAQSGADSSWGLDSVDQVIAAGPDLVLMEFAINDADFLDGASLRRSRSQHAMLIDRLGAAVAPGHVVLMTMNPVGGLHRALRALLPRYYALQVELADRHGTALADLYADWLALPPAQRRFPDGLHPTAEDTARVVVPGLVRRIAQAADRTCPPPA